MQRPQQRKWGESKSLKEGQVTVERELRAVYGIDEATELGRGRAGRTKEVVSQGKPWIELSRG